MRIAEIEGFRGMSRWTDRALLAESLVGRPEAADLLWARHESAAAETVRAYTGMTASHETVAAARELFRQAAPTRVWAGMPVRETVVAVTAELFPRLDGSDDHDYPAGRTSLVEAYRLLPADDRALLWFRAVDRMTWSDCAPMIAASVVEATSPRLVDRFVERWIAVSRGRGLPDECAHVRSSLFQGRRGGRGADAHVADCMPCSTVAVNRGEVIDRLGALLLASTIGSEAAERWRAANAGPRTPTVPVFALRP